MLFGASTVYIMPSATIGVASNFSSDRAWKILALWDEMVPKFVKVYPNDYRRMLQTMKDIKDTGVSDDEAEMIAFGINALVLPPSHAGPAHYHERQEETYFVHRGDVEIEFGDGSRHLLGPGAVALAPRGVFYDLIAGPQGMVCSALSKFPVRVVEKG